jgi:Domain of unknown function (DUF1851)
MQIKLTWNDLLIQNISESDAQAWFSCWSGKVPSRVAPVFMSKFGDWFLRLPDGRTDELSVIEGTYETIASTPDEFVRLVNLEEWQKKHLMSLLVLQLHERGMIPKQGQCYAFAPHPVLTGQIELGHAMLMDVGVWQNICAQTVDICRSDSLPTL